MDAESSKVPSQGQGHRLRRLLIAQVAHSGCGSRVTDNPNWFQASRYSILQSSLSSAESRYHCLQTREQLRRSTQSSCENTRAITCAGARSAGAESRTPASACSPPCRGGAMADPPLRLLCWSGQVGCRKPRSIRDPSASGVTEVEELEAAIFIGIGYATDPNSIRRRGEEGKKCHLILTRRDVDGCLSGQNT